MFSNPTIDDFKTYFVRDFPFGTDITKNVLDQDVSRAFSSVYPSINPALFADQADYSVGFNLLAAHWLVMNLRASSQGIAGQFSWLQSSKSVGSVSESFAIPQRIMDNPAFALLTKTNYGAQYLQLILPSICGQVFIAQGDTTA